MPHATELSTVNASPVKIQFPKSGAYLNGNPARVLTALVLAHAGIQVGTLGMAYCHLRLTPAAALALVGFALLGALAVALATGASNARPRADEPGPVWLLFFPALAAMVYCVLLARAFTLPDYSWDGNTYHIPPMNYWARAGYVHWVPVTPLQSELMNGYPKGAELLTWVLATLLRRPRFISAANFGFLPLGIAGIATLCNRLGTSRRMAWACGSLLACVPVLLWQSVTSYVDCAFGCTAIAALALLGEVQEEWADGLASWRSALGLGCTFGLLCAIKSSGLLLTAAALLGLLGTSAVRAGSIRQVRWTWLAGAGVTCAGVGGYWYLRNYVHAGSPLFPVGFNLAGHTLFPGRSISDILDFAGNTPALYLRWPAAARTTFAWAQGVERWPNTSFGWDGRLGGLGYLWLAGCMPSVLAVLGLRGRRLRKAAPEGCDWTLALLTGVVTIAFFGTPLNWWARYTVWIYALGLPCLGVFAAYIFAQPRKPSIGRIWLSAVVLLSLGEGGLSLVQIVRNADPGDPEIRRLPEPRPAVGEGCAVFPEAEGTLLQAVLLGRESVGLAPISGDTEKGLLIGPLSLPLGARDVLPIPASTAPDFDQLQRHHVRYLIYDAATPLPNLPPARVLTTEEITGFRVVTLR